MSSTRSPVWGEWLPVGQLPDPDGIVDRLPEEVRRRGAWRPAPLPSDVTFSSSAYVRLEEALGEVIRADEMVRWALSDRSALTRATLLREVQSTCAEMDIQVALREILVDDLGGEFAKRDVLVSGARRHVVAAGLGAQRVLAGADLDPEFLGRAASLDPGRVARWREGPAWLGGPDPEDAYLVVCPPGPYLRSALPQWCTWEAGELTIPRIGRLAMGYFGLEALSPFGFVPLLARQYVTWGLLKSGTIGGPILPITEWLRREERALRDCVLTVVERHDFEPLVLFFADGMRTLAREQVQFVHDLRVVRESMLARLPTGAAKAAVDILLSHPVITNRLLEQRGISRSTASETTNKLAAEGLLTRTSYKRPHVYVCGQVLNLMTNRPALRPGDAVVFDARTPSPHRSTPK